MITQSEFGTRNLRFTNTLVYNQTKILCVLPLTHLYLYSAAALSQAHYASSILNTLRVRKKEKVYQQLVSISLSLRNLSENLLIRLTENYSSPVVKMAL